MLEVHVAYHYGVMHVLILLHMSLISRSYGGANSVSEGERYQRLGVELIRALRGKRSRAELSKRAGYRSNIVQRWETGVCAPSASCFLQLYGTLKPRPQSWLQRFYKTPPGWVLELEPSSRACVAAFLRHLRGQVSIKQLADGLGRNRYTVSRWLHGSGEPTLPELLQYVAVVGGRLVDFAAAFFDPQVLPSVRDAWSHLQLARKAAYELPWSHGVLRALEVKNAPAGLLAQKSWLASTLNVSVAEVQSSLDILEVTGQVKKSRSRYKSTGQAVPINTSENPERARALRLWWAQTGLDRLKDGHPGRSGYSVFSVSKKDLAQIQQLHLQFVRTMQQLIAKSESSECVALYCSQLMNLGGEFPAGESDGTALSADSREPAASVESPS